MLELQALDRVHRLGQKKEVIAVRYVVTGADSVEEVMAVPPLEGYRVPLTLLLSISVKYRNERSTPSTPRLEVSTLLLHQQ